MPIYSIYRITNLVNGKCYIGFGVNPRQRWSCHKNSSKSMIGKSIKKYGVENHIQEILYQSADQSHCRKMETHFIREHNSHYLDGRGYNMTYGGEGELGNRSRTNMPHSPESIRKMSESSKGCRAWNRQKYHLVHDDGTDIIIDTLSEVTKWNLNPNTMKTTLRRSGYNHKGWRLKRAAKN